MAEEQKRSGIGGIGDGIRAGIGILSAFKEAVEETLQEAVDRGDLSPDRAKRAVQDAVDRIQNTFEGARDRVDLVSRREFDELRAEVGRLREEVERSRPSGEAAGPTPPGIIITE
jgi:polyhydroxyalkanoate synthesis regulator phasin